MADPSSQHLPPNQPGLTPQRLITTYSPQEWEAFIEEWAEGFDPPYTQVVRLGGAGDMGRDIIGHIADLKTRPCPCDVYQCKHYDHALYPADSYLELGKLCVYTHRGAYPVPRRYRFAPPRGVGPGLYNLLNHPDELRAELIANWDQHCRRGITKNEEIPLTGALEAYVLAFDFSIVWFLQPNEIIDQHQRTKYWHRRFKIDPPVRPAPAAPPESLQSREMPYIECLLQAYADRLKRPVTVADLSGFPRFLTYFSQTRAWFFSAEALARFSRDHFTAGAFEMVKEHLHDGVVDVTVASHADGLACLLEVMKQAACMALPPSDLMPHVWPSDKKGMCHHLANDGRIAWVQES